MDLKKIGKRGRIVSTGTSSLRETSGASFEKELKDVGLLGDAFDSFNSAAETLTNQYSLLEKRVAELNSELAQKNIELEESLEKTSKMERYQASILRSLASAVIVADRYGVITLFNSRAEEILSLAQHEVIDKSLKD